MEEKPDEPHSNFSCSESNLTAITLERSSSLCRFQSVHSEDCMEMSAAAIKIGSDDALPKCELRKSLVDLKRKPASILETSGDSISPTSANRQKYENYRSFETPLVRAGINIFNENSKDGLAYLMVINFLQTNPASVAQFLKNVQFLSKDKIGEVIGSISNNFCLETLNNFVSCFDFTSMYPDEALRSFQKFFRMPGEAQKIHAILDKFAERYLFCNQDSNLVQVNNLLESEAILVLVYAIVMLNTDLHNPSVKFKMSLDQFLKNMEGVESCKEIPKTFLKDIYSNISKREFSVGFDHMKQLNEMSSLISGKGLPQIVLPQRQFIGIRDVNEIRSLKYPERCCLRSLFIFNDLVIFTRSVNSKSIKQRFSLINNKGSFYFYVKSIDLKHIQPIIIESKSIPFNVLLVTHSGDCVAILDCVDSKNRAKVFADFKQFCYEAYLTDFILKNIPEKFFKCISSLIGSDENIFTHKIVADFKFKLDSLEYPVLKFDPANIVYNPQYRF